MNTFPKFFLFSSAFVSSIYLIIPTANASKNILVQDKKLTLEQNKFFPNLDSTVSLNQITNVSSLRDVSPKDWAFEALRSLVERYGCIVGYPDSTLLNYQFYRKRPSAHQFMGR